MRRALPSSASPSESSLLSSSGEDLTVNIQTRPSDKSKEYSPPSQIYLRPDISSILIEILKFYDWKDVYYIYNYPQGNILSLSK